MTDSIGLWGLKDENIFVKLRPDFVKSMFDVAINMAGNQRMLARRLGLVDSMICFYKKGNNFIQIGVLSGVLDMLPEGMRKEFESGIVENIIEINIL